MSFIFSYSLFEEGSDARCREDGVPFGLRKMGFVFSSKGREGNRRIDR
jgi:hypothetical protein